MKKLLCILTTVIIYTNSWAQLPAIVWSYTYSDGASINSIKQTSDAGYILLGSSLGKYWVAKYTGGGILQWQKTYGGTGGDVAKSIIQTIDGGYILAGNSMSNNGDVIGNHGSVDYWIVKISSIGVLQWQKTLGGSNGDFASEIQQTTDGGYIVSGNSTSNNGDVTGNHGGSDYWIVKMSSTGVLQWQKTLGGTSDDLANSIKQTIDGGYIVSGSSASNDGNVTGNHGGYDYWMVKLSTIGTIQWQKTFGGKDIDNANQIQTTSDGGYIVVGKTNSNDGDITGTVNSFYRFWIVKFSNIGALQWQRTYSSSNINCSALNILQTADDGYIVGGNYGGNGRILKLSTSGNVELEWEDAYRCPLVSIQQTSDQGYISVFNSGIYFFLKKRKQQSLSINTFKSQDLKIYPNPAAHFINISTTNNQRLNKIQITDLTGKVIIEKDESGSKERIEERNTNQINIEELSCGVYMIEAFSGQEKFVSKFVKN